MIHPGTRDRIAKLLLMLSSDKDGDVVAAAGAIGRTLQAEGATWHDLASMIVADQPDACAAYKGHPSEIAQAFQNLLSLSLTQWERHFVDSVRGYWLDRGRITEKQAKVLNDIQAWRHRYASA